jgi:CelD/BcsL family acetyltransferase involved in cellulose biosynthesis
MRGLEPLAIRSAADLSVLEDEWNELAERCPGYFLSQTHRWADAAWRTVALPRGRTLAGVALRFEKRLVAVWPLVVYRAMGVRMMRPLGPEASEYCSPLVEPGEQSAGWTAALWQAAAAGADVLVLPFLPADSPLSGIVRRKGWLCFAEPAAHTHYVARRDYADWASFHATIGPSHRAELRRKRRRIADQGVVTFEQESPNDAGALIDWLLDCKKRWLVDRGLRNDWIGRPDYRDFLLALVSRQGRLGNLTLFVLKLDGVPLAAQLNSIDRSRVESYIVVYDPRYHRFSLGEIMNEECIRWAIERDLDYDFRIGDQSFKSGWAKAGCDVVSCHVATSWRGAVVVACMHARQAWRRLRARLGLGRFLPTSWRARLQLARSRRNSAG